MKKIKVGEIDVILYNVNGEIHATQFSCTHTLTDLSEGRLEGCIIECPLHGGMFDVRDGSVQALPAVTPLKIYPVKVENTVIHVDVDV